MVSCRSQGLSPEDPRLFPTPRGPAEMGHGNDLIGVLEQPGPFACGLAKGRARVLQVADTGLVHISGSFVPTSWKRASTWFSPLPGSPAPCVAVL